MDMYYNVICGEQPSGNSALVWRISKCSVKKTDKSLLINKG